MKTLILLGILAGAMSAQDFHGVSVGGTAEWPTIINHSGKAIIGFSLERINDNGVNKVREILSLDSIARGDLQQDGEERSAMGLMTGVFGGVIDHATGKFTMEGNPLRYELKGVLFGDGTYVGADDSFESLAARLNSARSFARDMQHRESRHELLKHGRINAARDRQSASFSPEQFTVTDLAGMAFDKFGAAEADKVLARFAELPDVVKGEMK